MALDVSVYDVRRKEIVDRVVGRRHTSDRCGLPVTLIYLSEVLILVPTFLLLSIPFQVFFFSSKLLVPVILDDTSIPDRIVGYLGVGYALWLGLRFVLPTLFDLSRLRGTKEENVHYVKFSDVVDMISVRRSQFFGEVMHLFRRFHA